MNQCMDQHLHSAKEAAMQHNSFRHLRLLAKERSLNTLGSYAPMFSCFAIETISVLRFTKKLKL